MKRLIVMRHGKSSWEYQVKDKDRPLLERGITDAHLVSSKFNEANISIDWVYSSPANRALHTSMIFLRTINFSFTQFAITEALYDFTGDSVLKFIKTLDNTHETVAIFGHNYAFTHVVNMLGNAYIDNLPTSGLVELVFAVNNWEDVLNGTVKQTLLPKELR